MKGIWRKSLLVLGVAALLLIAACGGGEGREQSASFMHPNGYKQWSEPPIMHINAKKSYTAVLQTSEGSFTIELFAKEAPLTVNNFVFLAREGFYDGVVFHRIMQTFMIQTGDPEGAGFGGPGYRFQDELHRTYQYEEGIVAMANSGRNTNGSQFFICTGRDCENLNRQPNYTIFGRVTDGMDVVKKIAATPVGASSRGELSVPLEEVVIRGIQISEK